MNNLEITQTVAAVLALQMFVLTLMVSLRRISLGKEQGNIAKYPYQDGNDPKLQRRMRAFGNFAEYVPMCLILLGLLEYHNAGDALLWTLGGSFVLGRILHSAGMLINPHFPLPRIIGMFATYAVLLVSPVILLWN